MQTTDTVFMIRPASFGFNHQTASTNFFQKNIYNSNQNLQKTIFKEFDTFSHRLQSIGIHLIQFVDRAVPAKPDAIFPNNWISLFGPTMVLYPMLSQNRRLERQKDIIQRLEQDFSVHRRIDLTHYEQENKFLEGTGSVVFDHIHRKAYACLSERTHPEVLMHLCRSLGYQAIIFRAIDQLQRPIYHTNVMMNIGPKYVVFCEESIQDDQEKNHLLQHFEQDQRAIIDIRLSQVHQFAGNMLCLTVNNKPYIILSETALKSLSPLQIRLLEQNATLIPISIPTIEHIGGGSVRCMLTEIFKENRETDLKN